MPSIKVRQAFKAGGPITAGSGFVATTGGFVSSSGLYRDLIIPYTSVLQAASGVIGAASLNMNAPTGSGPVYLQFPSTSGGCNLTVQVPVPQDIALKGAAGAGSGLIIFDWMNASGDSKVVTIAACLNLIPSGSEWTTAGTCTLMTAASATMTAASALQLNSTSLAQFNAPATRSGNFVLRFGVKAQDAANTSGSDFHLSDIRLRYLSDRIGS